MNYYSVELPVKKLLYGVNRNKEWWEKYPRRIKMLNKLTESIEKEGLKNPLFVSETNKGYVVDVGNQRLQALNNLNYTYRLRYPDPPKDKNGDSGYTAAGLTVRKFE